MSKKENDKTDIQETPAGDTLKPHSMQGTPKTAAMADVVSIMQGMGQETINKFMEMMQQFKDGQAGDGVPDNAQAKNASTIVAKPSYASPAQEELEALFGGDTELTEEFKEKATTLFEAAVSLAVTQEVARLEEEFEQKITEETETILEDIIDQTDSYLNYVIEQWMEDNEVAIESTIRNELNESFMEELKAVFESHYIEIPEDRVDVVETLTNEIESLKDALNEQVEKSEKLEEELGVSKIETIFNEVTEGMTESQIEKMMGLTENMNFDSFEDYESKLIEIRDGFFSELKEESSKKLASKMSNLFEENEVLDDDGVKQVAGPMAHYVNTISKTAKN